MYTVYRLDRGVYTRTPYLKWFLWGEGGVQTPLWSRPFSGVEQRHTGERRRPTASPPNSSSAGRERAHRSNVSLSRRVTAETQHIRRDIFFTRTHRFLSIFLYFIALTPDTTSPATLHKRAQSMESEC